MNTRYSQKLPVFLLALAVLLSLGACRRPAEPRSGTIATCTKGNIEMWTQLYGSIESRDVRSLMSRLPVPVVLCELAADGGSVTQGQTVAQFVDDSFRDDLARAAREEALASDELHSLTQARIPLERMELEGRIAEGARRVDDEARTLADVRQLQSEQLVPQSEVERQVARFVQACAATQSLARQRDLTAGYIHPAAARRAMAALQSSSQNLASASSRVALCTIRADFDGILSHVPVPASGELRALRPGDTVFPNQVFLCLSHAGAPLVRCEVAERDLWKTPPGAQALVRPLALPGVTITGQVESVGTALRALPGRSPSVRFAAVAIALSSDGSRLRAGMSVLVDLQSVVRTNVCTVPRNAVRTESGVACCVVRRNGTELVVPVQIGVSDERNVEVLHGVEPGWELVLP